jgi:acid stress-induced BolA-like protein IbaG/YrbA
MDLEQVSHLIEDTLTEKLNVLRPRPRILIEENDYGDGVHVYVVSRYFSGMMRHERRDFVWDRLMKALPWEVVQNVTRLHVWTDREYKRWLAATDGTEAPEAEPAAAAAVAS